MVAEWQIKQKTLFLYGVMQERRRLGDVNSLFV